MFACLNYSACRPFLRSIAKNNRRYIKKISTLSSSDNMASSVEAFSSNYEKKWEAWWNEGVAEGEKWDARRSSPSLHNLLDSGVVELEGQKAIVPGCGRGYDVLLFAEKGANAVGLEISPTAVKVAEEYRDSFATEAGKKLASFVSGNFFEHTPDTLYDVGYDYTFLCAMHPETRDQWAQSWARIIKKGGILIALIFPVDPTLPSGPPFYVDPEATRKLLESQGFECVSMEKVEPELSFEGRQGKEYLARFIKK